MTNEAPGAFGYLWFQQKGTKGAVGVLVVSHFLGFRGEKRIVKLYVEHKASQLDR
jgi:hypothetical protein